MSSTQRHQPAQAPAHPHETTLTGKCYVVDGDTIRIGKVNIRLAGVDAPELEHPWGKKAKWELVNLCKGQIITAEIEPDLSYDRLVATCFLPDGRDLSAEMVRSGMALDWPKFSGGKYQHLEPEGVRKKYWKAAARQRGHMHVFHK
ncbi:nuclease homologue [Salinihabitans flavidus]|uniref:Nuclease homologue n=1 Tax=Salinihabitans flavidus TaxID=569882 RepID=A0A1H8WI68_9RHOB|nr:nuclease homologue [Salinihabitans flavidus]